MADVSKESSQVVGYYDTFNPQAGIRNSEATRMLDSINLISSGTMAVQQNMPLDTTIKRVIIKGLVVFQATFAAGSPLYSSRGLIARLSPAIRVMVNGDRQIKAISPDIQRKIAAIQDGKFNGRSYQISAAAPTVNAGMYEWLAGTAAFGATTEYNTIEEYLTLYFENPWGYAGSRALTELDLRNQQSAYIEYSGFNSANLLDDGNGASVTYNVTIAQMTAQIVENRSKVQAVSGQSVVDYVEREMPFAASAAGTIQTNYLNNGSRMMGVSFAAYLAATGLAPSSNVITALSLLVNAIPLQAPASMRAIQEQNKDWAGLETMRGLTSLASAAVRTAAGIDGMEGVCHLNLLRQGDVQTALDTARDSLSGVSTVQAELTVNAAMSGIAHMHELRAAKMA